MLQIGAAWLNAAHNTGLWLVAGVLAVLFPILDKMLYARLQSAMQIYVWILTGEWVLTVATIGLMLRVGLHLADAGERLGDPSRLLMVSIVVAAAVAGIVIGGRLQARHVPPEKMQKMTAPIRKLLPLTPKDRAVYVTVSVTAGLCEEFLYRGFLLNLLAAATGSVWVALALSSIAFGVGHLYQGWKGTIATGVLGLVFGVVFVVSASLLPSQIIHTIIDLNNGLAMGKLVRRTERAD